jgi:hypothetical protein
MNDTDRAQIIAYYEAEAATAAETTWAVTKRVAETTGLPEEALSALPNSVLGELERAVRDLRYARSIQELAEDTARACREAAPRT